MNPSLFLTAVYLGIASAAPELDGSLDAPVDGTRGRRCTGNHTAGMKKVEESSLGEERAN